MPRSCTVHLRRLQDKGIKSHRARNIQCQLITIMATQGERASREDDFLKSSAVEDMRLELAFKCLVVGIFGASQCFPGGSDGKESACNAGDLGLIPRLGRSPGGGNGNPLQSSCLENPHGQRSLAGYCPWGGKELDTTERLSRDPVRV